MVEARNYVVIQTLLHIGDVPPVLIDPKSIDRHFVRGNDGDTVNESDEDNNGDLVDKISEHCLEDTTKKSAEYGPSNDKIDQPPSHRTSAARCHPGCKQGSGTAENENVHRVEENNEALDDEIDDSEGIDVGHLLRTLDDHPTQGACKQIKTSRIVRTTREKIRFLYNSKTHENALANPSLEMLDRGVNQWVDLCNHLNSNKFKKASSANIVNRLNKKYNHHTCSRPFSYIVEKMVEMLVEEHEYLIERAKEQQLPEDNPLDEIPIDDPDTGINIMMSVLDMKPGRRILGL
ncbi:Hypothetical predicted protein [Olea europaea subsp. europaea]|uniref:Uncharacterized protein n=1 Tax=Olea europaea subsp. europaea TaxID=158383 RepID=A0A8S0TDJ3_OLEEU|nr:Hypothetical predicted protein [Olea europaea subsp. europaea]